MNSSAPILILTAYPDFRLAWAVGMAAGKLYNSEIDRPSCRLDETSQNARLRGIAGLTVREKTPGCSTL